MGHYILNRKTHKIAYTHNRGNGPSPALVFLPGYRSDRSGTKALYLQDLAHRQNWPYISLDYYGHGQSEGKPEDGSLSLWIEDTLAVLRECGYSDHIMVGSSMGVWIMLRVAVQTSVRRLIGLAGAPDFTGSLATALGPEARHAYECTGCFVHKTPLNPQGWIIKKHFIDDGEQNFVLKTKIPISAPVDLIHGLQDTVVPWQVSQTLLTQLDSERVSLLLLKNGDHQLSRPEDLETLRQTVTRAFLS